MPERDYLLPLAHGLEISDRARVWMRTDRGQVVDFVVQYEAFIAERFYPIVRYDGSHGRGHRDIIDRSGNVIRKDWLPEHVSLGQALDAGLEDIEDHWHAYRAEFVAREGLVGGEL